MEIQPEELSKILEAYQIKNPTFIGYEQTAPDDTAYYFSCDNDLFVLLASDYVTWGCGNGEPPKELLFDYYKEDHNKKLPIKKWLTTHDGLDKSNKSGDFEGYIYWASNGDRCTLAKIDGKFSDFNLDNLEKNIPRHTKTDIAIYAYETISAEIISAVPRPDFQNSDQLCQNICNAIIDDIKQIAKYFLKNPTNEIKLEDIYPLQREFFMFASEWDKYYPNDSLTANIKYRVEKELIKLNNQSWLAYIEFRKSPESKQELKKLLRDFEEFVVLF